MRTRRIGMLVGILLLVSGCAQFNPGRLMK